MRSCFPLLITVFLAAAIFLGGRPSSLLAADTDKADRSAYEEFMDIMGGEIPYPPEKLIEKLQNHSKTKPISVTATIFPNGRSLERKYTSYEKPRTLLAIELEDQLKTGKTKVVFLAFTPGNDGMQIISTDSKGSGNEFRVVSDYARGKNPRVEMPPKALCTSCHQNGGPLFTRFPWSETEANPKIRDRLFAEKRLDSFPNNLLHSKDGPFVNVSPYVFEGIVNSATPKNPNSRLSVCSQICQTVECNEALLRAAISVPLVRTTLSTSLRDLEVDRQHGILVFGQDALTVHRSLIKNHLSALNLIQFRDHILNDRNAFSHENDIIAGPGNDPLAVRAIKPGTSPDSMAGLNLMQSDLGGPVAMTRLQQLASDCMRFTSSEAEAIRKLDPAEIMNIFKSGRMSDLIFPSDSSEVAKRLLSLIKGARGSLVETRSTKHASRGDCDPPSGHLLTNEASKVSSLQAVVEKVAPRNKTQNAPPGALFQVYCTSCHGDPLGAAPYLVLNNAEFMRNYKGTAGRTVASVLSPPDLLMPPKGAPAPSDEERKIMLDSVGGPVTQPAPSDQDITRLSPAPTGRPPFRPVFSK